MIRILSLISSTMRYKTNIRPYSSEVRAALDGNIEREKKLKIIELEISIMRQEGRKVPNTISQTEWDRLLELKSLSARRKYLTFLFTCEIKNENKQKKKEDFKEVREANLAEKRKRAENNEIVYGLGYNSFFLKIYETKINMWYNKKLVNAMQFEQKLIIDCSYDEYMTFREADNCAKQLTYTFAMNRLHPQPFDLYFCNFDRTSKSGRKLINHIPTMLRHDYPMNVMEKSYMDLFDSKKLVYLTPHCRNELMEYNHEDIYIVGAMVDKANNEPISLAKAKKNGLRMAKLPLDKFLNWGIGGKSLTINQMIEILLEMKISNNWKQALQQFVPKRKLFKEFQQSHLLKNTTQRKITIHKDFSLDDDSMDIRNKNERQHFKDTFFNLKTWGNTRRKV